MNWRTVARADIKNGVRSRSLWAVVVVFVLLLFVFGRFVDRGSLLGALFDTNARTFALLLTFLFVPIAGLLVGHRALVRASERAASEAPGDNSTTGEGDVGAVASTELFIGTVVGRTVVLAVAVFGGFLPVFVAWLVQSGTAAVYEIVVAFLVAVLFGLLFVAVALAISTLTASRAWAATGAVGAFIGLYAWPFLPSVVGLGVPYALLEQFWLVFVVGDISTTLFSLRQGELTASVLGLLVMGVSVTVPLALGYVRLSREGLPS